MTFLLCKPSALVRLVVFTRNKLDTRRHCKHPLGCSGALDKTIRVWNALTGVCRYVLKGHSDWVYSVAWSPGGRRICSGAMDNTLRVWNALTGVCERVLEGHFDGVLAVAWSPGGRRICSGSADDNLRVWNVSTQACIHEFRRGVERATITCLAFS